MTLYLGIDGGGTGLRVALCDADMQVVTQTEHGAANPSSLGHDAARARVQAAVGATLGQAGVSADAIAGAGVGIAGAAAEHARDWLHDTLRPLFPASTHLALSSDVEIALVGARGERRGILILAGTGSAAYGVNSRGESALVGGWGWLLGDEGSGYWIGMQALGCLASDADRNGFSSTMYPQLINALQLKQPRDLVKWLYPRVPGHVAEVAALAPIVLQAAERGEDAALRICDAAASALGSLYQQATDRLGESLPAAFAGGLLSHDNRVRQILTASLGLLEAPVPLYPPVVGAALLAKLKVGT